MIVCGFCKSGILESTKWWDYHHTSYSSLQHGADQLCVICSSLRNDVESILRQVQQEKMRTPTLSLSADSLHWPLYRWTLRRSGGTTESLKTIVVTLRPMFYPASYPQANGHDREDGNIELSASLPDRVFHLISETDLGILPHSVEHIGQTTDPAVAGVQIKRWLEHCRDHHQGCMLRRKAELRNGSKNFIPTRLVDVGRCRGDGGDDERVWIVETAKQMMGTRDYMTLSHCWGPHEFLKLQTETREQFIQEGIAVSDLSTTFQQAIIIARFLDVRYIWIDSLCIIQGDGSDFGAEGDLMHKIYRNSFLNIAAADSPDSWGGLFRNRDPAKVTAARYIASKGINVSRSALFGQKTWYVLPEDLYQQQLLDTIIYTRGWVFQERMLAPRLIHFATNQLFWDCATMTACETLPLGLPNPLDKVSEMARQWRGRLQEADSMRQRPLAGFADLSLDEFWRTAVKTYTSCHLTRKEDKLRAIWGIAKLLRDGLNEDYAAGLWEYMLQEQLAWRVSVCRLHERPPALRGNPSWSWASMEGAIDVYGRISQDREDYVRDHHGEQIHFESDISIKRRKGRFKTLAENLEYDLAQWKEKGRRPGSSATSSPLSPSSPLDGSRNQHVASLPIYRPSESRDRQPMLRSGSIAIQGHIGRAQFRQSRGQRKWTLGLPIQGADENATISEATVEVFPDVLPKAEDLDEMCYFIVLAWGKDPIDKRKPIWILKAVEDFNYSGVGIIVKQVGEKGHFERTGALSFQYISPRMWIALQATYCKGGNEAMGEYEEEKGFKFWLD